MYMRAVTTRIVYLGIASLGILLSVAFRQAPVLASTLPATAPQLAATRAPALLPTVTLATVHVRAAAQQPGAAAATTSAADDDAVGARRLPNLRLDMPYYAFGKLLPRVAKD